LHTRIRSLPLSKVLAFAGREQEMANRLRRMARYEFRHPVRVLRTTGRDGRAVSYDISELGIGLFAPFACEIGEQVTIRVPIPDHGVLEQTAIVMKVTELARGLWELGCLFRRWSEDAAMSRPREFVPRHH